MVENRIHRRALIALAGAAAFAGCTRTEERASFKAIDITGADYAQGFDYPDIDGRRRTLAEFAGKLVVVFFGYTQCPDVCPTTMVELAEVRKALGADAAKVQGVFVTLDPERDTPQVLKAYLDNFGGELLALRGNAEQTKLLAKQFKVYYQKVPGASADSYTLDHVAGSYIFDTRGRIRLFTRYGSGADALKHDLQLLLTER